MKSSKTLGDGQIDKTELREIIKSCIAENGMEFDEEQVDNLAQALYRFEPLDSM